jgi:hypothetical protein
MYICINICIYEYTTDTYVHTESEVRHEIFRSQFDYQLEKALEEEKAKFSSFHARPVPKIVNER